MAVTYANGLIPSSALGQIGTTGKYIRKDLVPQTNALRAAFQAHFGKPLNITDGYRSRALQETIFFQRYTPQSAGGGYYGDVRWYNGVRYVRKKGTAAAAVPGTSNHGWGQAIDFGSGVNSSLTSAEYRWMAANAPKYGWTHPAWARNASTLEPWHWEAILLVSFPGSNTGGGSINIPPVTPIDPINPIPVPEDDMYEQADRDRDNATLSAARESVALSTQLIRDVANLSSQVQLVKSIVTNVQAEVRKLPDRIDDRAFTTLNTLMAKLDEVQNRMPLATRKIYEDIEAAFPSYTAMASESTSYGDLAGVRDPLEATVTVDAVVNPDVLEGAVSIAVQEQVPAIATAVADEQYRRQKE